MRISGTTDVLHQRRVVDVTYISLAEVHLSGEAGGEEARTDSLLGRLAHA
jgi:hypothetical protein